MRDFYIGHDEDIFSSNHSVHMHKMQTEKYVYITDKTSIELEMEEDCELNLVKEYLDMKFYYSVGMRNNSAFSQLIGEA